MRPGPCLQMPSCRVISSTGFTVGTVLTVKQLPGMYQLLAESPVQGVEIAGDAAMLAGAAKNATWEWHCECVGVWCDVPATTAGNAVCLLTLCHVKLGHCKLRWRAVCTFVWKSPSKHVAG